MVLLKKKKKGCQSYCNLKRIKKEKKEKNKNITIVTIPLYNLTDIFLLTCSNDTRQLPAYTSCKRKILGCIIFPSQQCDSVVEFWSKECASTVWNAQHFFERVVFQCDGELEYFRFRVGGGGGGGQGS